MPDVPDRPLDSISITHDDGTTIIGYSEDKKAFREVSSSEGSGAERIYYCKWEDVVKFREALEGFNEVRDADMTIGTRYLHRANPHPYEMGYYDTPNISAGPRYWTYCVKTELVGERELEKYVKPSMSSVAYRPWYKYAAVKATYAALDYPVLNDPFAYEQLEGSGGNYRVKEWVRNCRVTYKQGGKYTVDRTNYLKWAESPILANPVSVTVANAVGSGFGVARWEPFADLVVTLVDLPYIPLLAMRRCQGKVNQELFLDGHPDYFAGFDPETMLFLGGEPVRQPTRLNRIYYTLTYYFREVHIRPQGDDTSPYGHNHLPRLVEQGTKRQYQRVSYDGSDSLVTGSPFIDVADFDSLFVPP